MTRRIVVGLIKSYQLVLSPFFAGSCRFLPSCSAYAAEAVHTHGTVKGLYLAACRLCRCHPLGSSGVDPVPPPRSTADPTAPAVGAR